MENVLLKLYNKYGDDMKKLYIILILCLLFIPSVKAQTITFNKCIDGDTASLKVNGKVKKVRFLAVDAPEIKHGNKKADPYGDEAKLYTCVTLKTAKKIEIEYDENSDKTDKYGRHLVWVFTDGNLLQEKLVKKGLAKVAYLYDDYKYTKKLQKAESEAKKQKLNIWGNYSYYDQYIIFCILFIAVVIICIFDKRFRKKTVNKVKKKVYDKTSSEIDKLFKWFF